MKNVVNRAKRKIGKTLHSALNIHSPKEDAAKRTLSAVANFVEGYDSQHIWVFFAGNSAQDFRGNPKYLFAYINNYRPDIKAWWICDDEEVLEQVRTLGWTAYSPNSIEGLYLASRTGIVVAEQVKTELPSALADCTYINLWHGIGFKKVERRLFEGDIAPGLAKKYIANGTFYRNHMLMLAPSPIFEKEFALDCGVDNDKFIKAGYPRCLYQKNFKPVVSFDHNIRTRKGLNPDARIVTYAPTFRYHEVSTISRAFPNLDKLYKLCEQNNLLFIFKMHPLMDKDASFLDAKEHFANKPHFLFWDNHDDFYEIMDQTDCLIVDYSSIISDAIAMGVKHYIRYIYDKDEYLDSDDAVHGGYYDRTCGTICENFADLCDALSNFEENDESTDIAKLSNTLWSYSQGKSDFETIISQALEFKVEKRDFPTLYSFDIFDTVFSRKVLNPLGVFYGVRERMQDAGGFPWGLVRRYPEIRHEAELSEREFFNKSLDWRNESGIEIALDDIFRRMSSIYQLSDKQIEQLKDWEIELELDNVIPLTTQIDRIKKLLAEGDTVILISDMYLPKDVIRQMLAKADPVLAELPFFLSNEYGVLKTTQPPKGSLYFEVYKSFKPYYDFEKWVHTGDNPTADYYRAKAFNICPRKITKPEFGTFQEGLVDYLQTYDAYLIAAMQSRLCTAYSHKMEQLTISYLSLCFVPYVDWVLRDAMKHGYKTLYFVSRDGHHLKRIADAIIARRNLNLKTKYVYGSRRLWRIPSYIDRVDDEYWSEESGNFNSISSVEGLLAAMYLTREQFEEFFPSIELDSIDFKDRLSFRSMVETFKWSEEFNAHLLKVAAERRDIVREYFLQEFDPNEKFAVVEYYGRGYNQDCHLRLWQDAIGDDQAVLPYYYARSILPSHGGSIRHNFSANSGRQYFIEAIFANMPYKSIESYTYDADGSVIPKIIPAKFNQEMFNSMEVLLPVIADAFAALELWHPLDTDMHLFDYVFEYYNTHRDDPTFANAIGSLVDMTSMYGTKREYAPGYTKHHLDLFSDTEVVVTKGNWAITSDPVMSTVRTDTELRPKLNELFQIMPDEPINKFTRALTPDELADSRKMEKQSMDAAHKARLWSEAYSSAAEQVKTQKNLVIFITKNKSVSKLYPYLDLKDELIKYGQFELKILCFGSSANDNIAMGAQLLARATCIVADSPIPELSTIEFREDTRFILSRNPPFMLLGDGLKANWWLKQRTRFVSTYHVNSFTNLQLPSDAQSTLYEHSYCRHAGCDLSILGSLNTDIYFSGKEKEFRHQLDAWFPKSAGKKLLLYMPVIREETDCSQWATLLNLDELHQLIGDEYAVVLQVSNASAAKTHVNIRDIPGFLKVLRGSKPLSIRELMMCADVIVGDYRNVFFESVMLHKPVFSTSYDYEYYLGLPSRNLEIFTDPEELLPGPLVHTSQMLAEHLADLDSYDYSKSEHLRELLFSYCDGKSAKRLAEYIASWCKK